MINFDDLKTRMESTDGSISEELSRIQKEKDRKLAELERRYEAGIAFIKERYDELIKQASTEASSTLELAKQATNHKAALRIYEALTKDAQELKSRSALASLSLEQLEGIRLATGREIQKELQPTPITSYIARVGGNIYAFVAPIRLEDENPLRKNLEDKLDMVFDVGEITGSLNLRVSKTRTVEGGQLSKITYSTQQEQPANSFSVYKIECKGNCEMFPLLKEKLEAGNIQPEGFKQVSLIHQLQEVSLGYLKSFITGDMARLLLEKEEGMRVVTDEEAARMLDYRVRGVRVITAKGLLVRGPCQGQIILNSITRYAGQRGITLKG
jgi:hypothetical protein